MPKKTVRELSAAGKRVLIRADLNVPLDAGGAITDDRRIREFLPTLRHIVGAGGRAIVVSHLGRPVGDRTKDAAFSLRPVAARLRELLAQDVAFCDDCIGPAAEQAARGLRDGGVLLLENLRFHPAETIIDLAKKNPDKKLTPEQDQQRRTFAASLASLGEAYVNDAFGTCHRKHVSMYDVPQAIPAGGRVVGFLVEKELRYLGQALENPRRPFVAVLGGSKVSDKIGVIRSLLTRVDQILIGGAMMFTFWAAQGRAVGRSLCEHDKLDLARELIAAGGDKLRLPVDAVAAAALKPGAGPGVACTEIPAELMGLDIGPQTVSQFAATCEKAGTIVWNGPLGAFEFKPFDSGTNRIAAAIADATSRGATSIIGGGDSASAVDQAGLAEKMSHISTGGGASLEFLEGKKFAPLDVLDEAQSP